MAFEKPKILDGSFCVELRNQGFEADAHRLWTFGALISCPDRVADVHKCFVDSGAEYLITNTYHGALPLLEQENIDKDSAARLINSAINMANEAAAQSNHEVKVLCSIGSFATTRRDASEYTGHYVDQLDNVKELMKNYYCEQVKLFSNASVILVETVPVAAEVDAIIYAAETVDFPFIVSFTCRSEGALRHGEPLRVAAQKLENNPKCIGIGINCTDPKNIEAALLELDGFNFDNIFVYPNNGDGFHGEEVETGSDDPFSSSYLLNWAMLGATVIGGCCGIGAEKIAELKTKLGDIFD